MFWVYDGRKLLNSYCGCQQEENSKQRSITCHMGLHSVICHPTEVIIPCLNPSQIGRYSIYLPQRDKRLSWHRWLVTYQDGLPACKQSPVQVPTRPGIVTVDWAQHVTTTSRHQPTLVHQISVCYKPVMTVTIPNDICKIKLPTLCFCFCMCICVLVNTISQKISTEYEVRAVDELITFGLRKVMYVKVINRLKIASRHRHSRCDDVFCIAVV